MRTGLKLAGALRAAPLAYQSDQSMIVPLGLSFFSALGVGWRSLAM
jgi:hypothetical protein